MIADLRRLVSDNASPSGNLVIEASSRVQGAKSTSRLSASSSGGSSSSRLDPGQRTRSICLMHLLPPVQVAGPAPRVEKVKRKWTSRRRNAPGSKGEHFVTWVPADTKGPQDLEEEESDERMTGLLDLYAARKRKR